MSILRPISRAKLHVTTVRFLAIAAILAASARQARATVITATPVDFVVNEGSVFNDAVAVFTDDNPAAAPADFTATIDWGDGSPTTAGTIALSSAAFTVLGIHTYADEGTFTVTVTIADQPPGTGTATATDTAIVPEADVLSGSPMTFSVLTGVSFTRTVATFTDSLTSAIASDFTSTINWGDATTSPGTITGGSGSFQVSGTHTYAASGTFIVTVTLTDDAPGTATAQAASTAQASNGLSVTASSFSTAEATLFVGPVATFTDTDTSRTASSFTTTINWGDGSTSAGTIAGASGSFTVAGQHTYAEEGSLTVTVTVSENSPGTATGSATGTATVTEADVLSGTPMTFTATATVPFAGAVASFSDSNATSVASGFTATIAWGDGTTTAGTVSGGSGSFTVSGTHTYAAGGSLPAAVTLTDNPPGTATATANSTANVSAAPASAIPLAVPALRFYGLLALGFALGIAALGRLRIQA